MLIKDSFYQKEQPLYFFYDDENILKNKAFRQGLCAMMPEKIFLLTKIFYIFALLTRYYGRVVRQRSAKPRTAVRIRLVPQKHSENQLFK